MTDAKLIRRWRNTERLTESSLALALVLGFANLVYGWPEWMLWAFMFPLLVITIACKVACVSVLRPWMDRRGLDSEAPVWWI